MQREHTRRSRIVARVYVGNQRNLFQKRQDLIRPIQDDVFGAIKDYAEDRGYDFIFDKGGSAGLIFSNEEYDKTDDIKKKVGGN